MQFETLKRSNLKRNIVIGVIVVAIISAIILNFTKAKYRVTQSIPLVNGTINYSPGDIIISAYFNDELMEKFPAKEDGYSIESIACDKGASATFNEDIWEIEVTNLVTKGTKCNVTFIEKISAKDTILANTKVNEGIPDFSQTATTNEGMYKAEDNLGTSYYFRGAVTNNYVQFAGFYWRIIRINGNDSIRIIYQGETPTATGENAQIGTSAFNNSINRSEYVGLKYTINQQHGQDTTSNILSLINEWYSNNNVDNYEKYIDKEIGFCSDRNMASGSSWGSQPSNTIYYAAYERLALTKNPSLQCNEMDLLQIPIGLITADEVNMAGGLYGNLNSNYYLNTGKEYWTMTPYILLTSVDGLERGAYVFLVWNHGGLSQDYVTVEYTSGGVRPVLNLSADVKLIGTGTSTDPYRIEGAE